MERGVKSIFNVNLYSMEDNRKFQASWPTQQTKLSNKINSLIRC